ncbi:hypothetical protein D3C73_1457160 [compost metagenome]
MLHGEHRTRTAVARLYLVVDQQHAVLLQQRFDFAEIRRGRHNHAAISLNRLYNHGRNRVALLLQHPFQAL